MKQLYLPKLNSIIINNYSLYSQEPSFEFKFQDGISAIIGGNGIGKTTFVEIVLFCLVGHRKIYPVIGKKKTKTKEKIIEPKFFISRMDQQYQFNKEASAYLDFNIAENHIKIGRSLYTSKIIYLEVNSNEVVLFDEDYYQQQILEFTHLTSFEAFDKIIRTFLFFDERRQNIAWDTDVQDEILRILFFDEEILNEFRKLEEDVVYLDTKGRHKSEDRRVEKESLDDLIKEKEKLFENVHFDDHTQNEFDKLLELKNNLEYEIITVTNELDNKLELFDQNQKILNSLIGERNESVQKNETITNELQRLESKLYSSMYNKLPDYYLSLEKILTGEGRCLACGSKSKQGKELALKHKEHGECIICSSKINICEEFDPDIIKKVNELSDQRELIRNEITNKDDIISDQQVIVSELNTEINSLREKINNNKREVIYLDSMLARHNNDNPDTYSQIVEVKQKKIKELTEEIAEIYKQRDQVKDKLQKIHKQFTKTIIQLNSHLSQFFNKYANTFIGLTCELTVETKTINKIPHVIYLPKISGTLREGVHSVSESQRFFLDQAFRMAIIDYLQHTIPGFNTFFITETPEGSLDIVYETQVAEMFNLFAQSSNNIIFTSNLNSSNFLHKIFEKIPKCERKLRSLNLLEKGNPTRLQKDNSELRSISNQLLGSDY